MTFSIRLPSLSASLSSHGPLNNKFRLKFNFSGRVCVRESINSSSSGEVCLRGYSTHKFRGVCLRDHSINQFQGSLSGIFSTSISAGKFAYGNTQIIKHRVRVCLSPGKYPTENCLTVFKFRIRLFRKAVLPSSSSGFRLFRKAVLPSSSSGFRLFRKAALPSSSSGFRLFRKAILPSSSSGKLSYRRQVRIQSVPKSCVLNFRVLSVPGSCSTIFKFLITSVPEYRLIAVKFQI